MELRTKFFGKPFFRNLNCGKDIIRAKNGVLSPKNTSVDVAKAEQLAERHPQLIFGDLKRRLFHSRRF